MTMESSNPAQTGTPPANGWLRDLNEEQRQNLIGAMVYIFSGARSTTGLLTDIEDGVARIFRDDPLGPSQLEFPVSSSAYDRVHGTPMRPALARALVHQREWDTIRAGLTDDEGNALHQGDYDAALATYEQGLPGVYDELIREYTDLLFVTPRTPAHHESKEAA